MLVPGTPTTYTNNSIDSPTTEWCSYSAEYVDIELVTDRSGYNQGSITLQVRGVITYNYNAVVQWSVGGVIGGIVLIACVIACVVMSCRRRSSRITYATQTTPTTIITQSASQQMGGYDNQWHGYKGAPPSYNTFVHNGRYENPSYQQYSTPAQQTT